MQAIRAFLIMIALPFLVACQSSGPATAPATAARAVTAAAQPSGPLEALLDRPLDARDALFIGAGDIAECGDQLPHAKETAALIDRFPTATVFAAGDNAYRNGTASQFKKCYGAAWGRFKQRTRPVPGNHDYGIYLSPKRNNADPYFAYFGVNAGPAGTGFYSYDLGGWHLVALNSMAGQPGAPTMADQLAWLSTDLDQNQQPCILAYWHHPLFSSGIEHGDQANDPGRSMKPLWDVLLDHHADVIVNGHDHHYERFGLQNASGVADAAGIREFIVGTGGGEDRGIGTKKANSEKRLGRLFGVLLLTLHPNSYDWSFLKTDGTVPDASTAPTECH